MPENNIQPAQPVQPVQPVVATIEASTQIIFTVKSFLQH